MKEKLALIGNALHLLNELYQRFAHVFLADDVETNDKVGMGFAEEIIKDEE
jgi:hypothetical protein